MASLQDVLPGARVAVTQCLAIGPEDRVFIITDEATQDIGQALAQAAQEQGAQVVLHPLEAFGQRPFTTLPSTLEAALRAFRPTATFFAAQGQPGEVAFRLELGRLLRNELKTRHGHMIGITPLLMRTGMRADYRQVAQRTMDIYSRVRDARTIRVTTPDGTDITVTLDPQTRRWIPCTGLYHQPGQWGNLPEGEVFTDPNGTRVGEFARHWNQRIPPGTHREPVARREVPGCSRGLWGPICRPDGCGLAQPRPRRRHPPTGQRMGRRPAPHAGGPVHRLALDQLSLLEGEHAAHVRRKAPSVSPGETDFRLLRRPS